MARQLNGDYEAMDPFLKQYCDEVTQCLAKFFDVKVSQVPKEQNAIADTLSKMALLPEEQ